MSNINTYQYGNTIRFECTFYDFDNKKVNPDLVKITIYNSKYEVMHEGVVLDSGEVGEFVYDYITENKKQRMYYEWYGEINGKPSLKRGEFMTEFI